MDRKTRSPSQAVREFGEIPFFYRSESEDLAVPKIEVQKVDGTIAPTTAAGVQDLAVRPAGGAPVFVDLREKVISVSALRPGDTVKVTSVWTTKSPIAPGQFWFEYSFNHKDTVRDEQLEIDVPAQRTVAMKIRAGVPAEERGGTGSVAGDRHVYR
ncbi:MAG TPA: DUF3857 domain-containing protein, partial [Vicinamibacterales bacterium]|nr:DUF3857 domain-containing protein [Vicinamibacterales bacterium]